MRGPHLPAQWNHVGFQRVAVIEGASRCTGSVAHDPNRKRRPLLIGIDAKVGLGKSSLAAWLSWQLEMPAIHLDACLIRDSEPLAWRLDDLRRVVDGCRILLGCAQPPHNAVPNSGSPSHGSVITIGSAIHDKEPQARGIPFSP